MSDTKKMTRALQLAIYYMKDYLAEQREFRAHEPAAFNKAAFGAIYAAVNALGYLDKNPE